MVVISAVASAVVAIVLSRSIFPELSVNNDETVYLLQARAFAGGHLFVPAGHPADSFIPWLGVQRGDHYVLKYVPVTSLWYALSLVLTGGYLAGLGALAAAAVGVTFLLAKEVTGSRRVAALAATLFAISPLVIVQSALLLPYLLFIVMTSLAVWALLVGCRRQRAPFVALAGLLAALALADRAYDGLLILSPAFVWMVWRAQGRRLRTCLALAGGAAVPVGALLWYNAAATGSALRLPFSLFQAADTLGFGVRRIYPGEAARHFGFVQGWQGLMRHLSLLVTGWAFGGLLLIGLAVFALLRRRAPAPCLAILAGGLLLTVGYLFFWGIWNASIVWGGTRYLGPYYLMPCLIPLVILGALGLDELARAAVWRPAVLVGLSAVISGVSLAGALREDAALSKPEVALANAVGEQGRSLVFVDTYPAYLQHPTAIISNSATPGGRTVYALARGFDDFAAAAGYPGRRLLRLRLLGEYGKHANTGYGAELDSLAKVTTATLTLDAKLAVPHGLTSAWVTATTGTAAVRVELAPGRSRMARFQLRSSCFTSIGSGYDLRVRNGSHADLVLLLQGRDQRHVTRTLAKLRLPLSVATDGRLTTLVPTRIVAELGPLAPPPLSVVAAEPAGAAAHGVSTRSCART